MRGRCNGLGSRFLPGRTPRGRSGGHPLAGPSDTGRSADRRGRRTSGHGRRARATWRGCWGRTDGSASLGGRPGCWARNRRRHHFGVIGRGPRLGHAQGWLAVRRRRRDVSLETLVSRVGRRGGGGFRRRSGRWGRTALSWRCAGCGCLRRRGRTEGFLDDRVQFTFAQGDEHRLVLVLHHLPNDLRQILTAHVLGVVRARALQDPPAVAK